MTRYKIIFILFCFYSSNLFSQGFPWERPLKMAWSTDGITFNTPVIFQDSSGVPSVVKWKGDTLVCAFQWFRAPMGSLTWDKVAVKFSYDNGISWTQPVPIVMNIPPGYQRPFDPTLVVLNSDSLRIYFSSSDGMPMGGLDSTVNTYSAVSADGINYTFESGARVDEISNRVIDPAVIYFNNGVHYLSPIGSPQQGAYHYISPDGINFTKVQDIPSDAQHNWTGNYMLNDSSELRFYGSGQTIWYKSTPNGGTWTAYSNTNLQGGDPAVVRTDVNAYLAIYVGNPNPTGVEDIESAASEIQIFPNPFSSGFMIHLKCDPGEKISIRVLDLQGRAIYSIEEINSDTQAERWINMESVSPGIYFLEVLKGGRHFINKLTKD